MFSLAMVIPGKGQVNLRESDDIIVGFVNLNLGIPNLENGRFNVKRKVLFQPVSKTALQKRMSHKNAQNAHKNDSVTFVPFVANIFEIAPKLLHKNTKATKCFAHFATFCG